MVSIRKVLVNFSHLSGHSRAVSGVTSGESDVCLIFVYLYGV